MIAIRIMCTRSKYKHIVCVRAFVLSNVFCKAIATATESEHHGRLVAMVENGQNDKIHAKITLILTTVGLAT